jgi:hypothetical protein
MNTIRISETVNNHDLVIPFELLKLLNHQKVEILVFPKEITKKNKPTGKKLLDLFKKHKGVNPFSEITDAVLWQKGIRNDW